MSCPYYFMPDADLTCDAENSQHNPKHVLDPQGEAKVMGNALVGGLIQWAVRFFPQQVADQQLQVKHWQEPL
jgi:hypothetical protein